MLNESLIKISEAIGIITEPKFLIILSLAISIYLVYKFSKKEGLLFTLTILSGGALVLILKSLVQRARPLDSLILETSSSFPSGHATISTLFFGLIAYLVYKKSKSKSLKYLTYTICILLIGIISYSRIILRVHWVSDVISGIILGIIILATSSFIYRKF